MSTLLARLALASKPTARHGAAATLLALVAPGCGGATPAPDLPAASTVSPEQASWDACLGPPPRGARGWHENGPDLVGTHVTGSEKRFAVVRSFLLDGMVSAEGAPIQKVRVERAGLVGELAGPAGPVEIKGARWEKARLKAVLTCVDGTTRSLDTQIASAYRDPAQADQEVWLYRLTFLAAPVSPAPACEADSPGAEVGAMAFSGVWSAHGEPEARPGSFSFSCADAAVAKCARLGYRPGEPPDPAHPELGRDLHAACTRMVRADYCGDGESATEKGTPVNLWDGARRIARGAPKDGATFEAAWSAGGAVCMSHPRWLRRAHECPGRAAPRGPAGQNEYNVPLCKSPAEAESLAGPGEVLLFNESSVHQ